jgi:acrylyl-CoA reductase (NADPH)
MCCNLSTVPTPTGPFKAFRISQEGERISGAIVETTLDALTPGDVVIKAAYSSVNYKDALAATGGAKILRKLPLIGGIDVAGVVASSSDARFNEGDHVVVTGYDLGVANDGGYAAYVRVPADWVVKLPPSLTLFEAMALGTAGFTAAMSVIRLEQNGLKNLPGPVIVTGATGGVGSIAVECLAARGYEVTALTSKQSEADYLQTLGARTVLARSSVQMGTRPLEKAMWAGAVDPVGGDVLAWLTRTTMPFGTIASSGLAGGTELHTTVLPFILRGVKLLGIESVACPADLRRDAWARLAADLRPKHLRTVAREISFDELPSAFATLLKGGARGRFVVKIPE